MKPGRLVGNGKRTKVDCRKDNMANSKDAELNAITTNIDGNILLLEKWRLDP